jgi:hypothetical protein
MKLLPLSLSIAFQFFIICNVVSSPGFICSLRVPNRSLSSLKVRSKSATAARIVIMSIASLESCGYCDACNCQYRYPAIGIVANAHFQNIEYMVEGPREAGFSIIWSYVKEVVAKVVYIRKWGWR